MGLFGRRKKPPKWARPLETRERYERFVDAALEVLGDRDPPVERWQVESGSVLLGEIELALDEAVEQCAEAAPERWDEIIASVVAETDSDVEHNLAVERDSEHAVSIGDRTIDLIDGDFEDIAPLLRVQMFSPHSRGAIEVVDTDAMLTRSPGGDLRAVVVFDFGSFEQTVDAEHARGWGPTDDEIWNVALENLVAEPMSVQSLETPGGEILMLAGNGNFVSSMALRWPYVLERIAATRDADDDDDDGDDDGDTGDASDDDTGDTSDDDTGDDTGNDDDTGDDTGASAAPHGVLLAMPTWHALLIHVIDPETSLGAIEPMVALTEQMAAELEDPVSPSLYWQAGPDAELLPLDIDDELAISEPEALVELFAPHAD